MPRGVRARIGSRAVLATIAAYAAFASAPALAQTVTTNWYAATIVKMSVTPNYASGYGPVKAVFGTQPTPAPAAGACLNGCAIDFGDVLSGTNYLYKYAVHVNVQSNDPSGVNVYGEGAADFVNTADNTTQAINQTVYYLSSTSGSGDSNTGFSSALPFSKTAGTVSGNSFATAPSITYGSFPSPISTLSTANGDLYYDYQLHVPPSASAGQYYVWIVYTVVGR